MRELNVIKAVVNLWSEFVYKSWKLFEGTEHNIFSTYIWKQIWGLISLLSTDPPLGKIKLIFNAKTRQLDSPSLPKRAFLLNRQSQEMMMFQSLHFKSLLKIFIALKATEHWVEWRVIVEKEELSTHDSWNNRISLGQQWARRLVDINPDSACLCVGGYNWGVLPSNYQL